MSYGKSKTTNSYSSEPTFNTPGASGLLESLINKQQGNLESSQGFREQGLNTLSSLITGDSPYNPSEGLTNYIQSIIANRNNELRPQLASTRSQYYRGPEGRNLMALDDAVVKNKLGTDEIIAGLLQDQFNQDRNVTGNAANNLISASAMDDGQVTSLLSLLRGEKGKGTQRTSTFQFDGADALRAISGALSGFVGA